MKIQLLWVGRTRDRRLADLVAEYARRAGRYCRIEMVELKEPASEKSLPPAERARRESGRLIEAMRPGTFRIALDERGRQWTSTELAGILGKALEGTPAGVTLIFGGAYGLDDRVLEASRLRWSLSKLTLTHETARFVALEQVYRAFTILRGESYHH